MNDLAKQILRRVRGRRVVIADDFADMGSRARVSRALASLAKAGTLRRVGRGLYYRPRRSPLLPDRTLPPEFGSILAALERQMGVTLGVSPLDAAHTLGLEPGEQVQPLFATSGRRRNVQVAGWRFQLVPPVAWARPWMHRQGFIVLQALAYLSPNRARDPEVANTLGKSISRAMRRDLVAGWTTLPQWVREVLGRAIG